MSFRGGVGPRNLLFVWICENSRSLTPFAKDANGFGMTMEVFSAALRACATKSDRSSKKILKMRLICRRWWSGCGGGLVLRSKVLREILHQGIDLVRRNVRAAIDHRLHSVLPIVEALVRFGQVRELVAGLAVFGGDRFAVAFRKLNCRGFGRARGGRSSARA